MAFGAVERNSKNHPSATETCLFLPETGAHTISRETQHVITRTSFGGRVRFHAQPPQGEPYWEASPLFGNWISKVFPVQLDISLLKGTSHE